MAGQRLGRSGGARKAGVGGAAWRREAGVGAVGLGCFSIEVRGQRW